MTDIIIEALGQRRTFTDTEALAEYVAEIVEPPRNAFDLDPLEIRAIQRLAELNGAATARVREIAESVTLYEPERPRIETPLDDRVRVAEQEAEAAEADLLVADRAWRSAERELEREAAERFRRAGLNSTKLARAQAWLGERQAAVQALEFEYRAADDARRSAVARRNALLAAASRWRQDQDTYVMCGGETLTLAQFQERRRQHE